MNFDINLAVTGAQKVLAGANATDTLTEALKAEQRALKGTQVALARMQAGSKVDIGLVAKAREGSARIETLKKQLGAAKVAGEQPTKLGFIAAIEKSGGPIGGLIRNVKAAWGALKESPAAALAVGLIGLTAVTISLGSRLAGLARDALTMGLGFADGARSAKLLNEAADIAGGTHKQLGGIIEDVRRRSDLGRDRLGELGRSLRVLRFDSRQTQLALSAMAIAESTLGTEGSSAVQSIAEQSRAMRKFSLGAKDAYGQFTSLQKTGLTKADVFKELSLASGKSIGDIQRSVSLGGITITRGLAAIDSALRKKFGGTAQAQALSLTSQFRRMREDFEGLFAGADMEPLLVGLKSITSIFSQDTASGRSFKEITTRLLSDVGDAIVKLTPDVKEFFLSLGAGAAGPGGLAESIRGWITDAKEFGGTLKDVATAIKDIASAAKTVGGAFGAVKGAFTTEAKAPQLDKINQTLRIDAQLKEQGKVNGSALTAGIAAGIDSGSGAAVLSITGLADKLKATWAAKTETHSPSEVYKREGRQIPAGVGEGVRAGAAPAVEAVVNLSGAMQDRFSVSTPNLQTLMAPRGGDIYIQEVHVQETDGSFTELVRQIRMVAASGPKAR